MSSVYTKISFLKVKFYYMGTKKVKNLTKNTSFKLKTRKSARKRFRKTVNGYYIRRRAFRAHLLSKKNSKRKRRLAKRMTVFYGNSLALKSMLPYLK